MEKSFGPVLVEDQDVVLLQMKASHRVNIQDVVFIAFTFNLESRRRGSTWLAFHRGDATHHAGKSAWLGLSKSIPRAVLESIHGALASTGLAIERETGRALHHKMNPFARLSDDGLEVLTPSALVGDPAARRVIERSGAKPIARGYLIAPRATAKNPPLLTT